MDAPLPFSREVLRRQLGARPLEDAAAIQRWLRGGPEPDFEDVARYVVPALETILLRGWLHLSAEWEARVRETLTAASRPSAAGFRGPVAEALELVCWALYPDRPLSPPKAPLAAQMALGRPKG